MKRKKILFALVFVALAAGIAAFVIMEIRKPGKMYQAQESEVNQIDPGSNTEKSTESYPRVAAMADMITFTYEELKDHADVIAKVKVLDALTKDNSVYEEPKDRNSTSRFYSLREVEVLELYKNTKDWKVGETRSVEDAAAILKEDGEWGLYTFDEYNPLDQGTTYILFLWNRGISHQQSVICCENGVVNLDQPKRNVFFKEIAEQAIAEFIDQKPVEEN